MDLITAEKNLKVYRKRLSNAMLKVDAAMRILSMPVEKENGHPVPVNGYGLAPDRIEKAKVLRGVLKHKPNPKRQLQGRYLGAVRPLTKQQRKKVSEFREKHGFVKAIALAKRLQD